MRHLPNNAFICLEAIHQLRELVFVNSFLVHVKFLEEGLDLILFPLNERHFSILTEFHFVLVFFGWYWKWLAFVRRLSEVSCSLLHFSTFLF